MAVHLKFHDKEFERQLNLATRDGMRRAAVFTHTQMRLAVNKSNRRGREPSKPGEAPRKRTGFGQSGIVWEFDDVAVAARIGVTKNAIFMAHLELGTRAHVIRPRHAKVLRIPYRKQGRPTEAEIEKHGWRRGPADGQGNRWFRFVRKVRHPGTAPRPFMLVTVFRHKETIARLACTGGPSSLR